MHKYWIGSIFAVVLASMSPIALAQDSLLQRSTALMIWPSRMTTLDEIGQEKQRICDRRARLDAERTKLGDQLNELEIAALSRPGLERALR